MAVLTLKAVLRFSLTISQVPHPETNKVSAFTGEHTFQLSDDHIRSWPPTMQAHRCGVFKKLFKAFINKLSIIQPLVSLTDSSIKTRSAINNALEIPRPLH
jgi:hypothetical protein